MPEFLTAEWITELDDRVRCETVLTADLGTLTVEQVVRDAPGGELHYHLVVHDGMMRVRPGPATDPDVRFLVDYATAVELHRGALNLQQAVASGRCRLQGPLQGLRGREAALRTIGDVFASVRARTTYA